MEQYRSGSAGFVRSQLIWFYSKTKPADLDLFYFLKMIYLVSAGQRVKIFASLLFL